MKKIFFLSLCLSFFVNGFSQTKTKITNITKKPAVQKVVTPLPSPVGKWSLKQENGKIDSLVIKSDSTYRFAEYQPGVSTPESFGGKWKVKGKDVFLYAGADPDPYGQVRAILNTDATKIEKFKVVRYFGDLQKGDAQIELTEKK